MRNVDLSSCNSVVICKNVSRNYQQGEEVVHALSHVSLELSRGSFVSLCGPSGSGKTTLLNLIGGLDVPTEGSVSVAGVEVSTLDKAARAELRLRSIGFVFQAYNLIPVLSAIENVEFVMQLQGVAAAKRRQRARATLEEVGLSGLENRRPGELSGGQQQRVAVARALVTSPEIILADEPTANLDSTTARMLLEIMRRMNDQRGVTFVFSTHDKLVMEFAKRIVHLHDGEVIQDELRG